MNWPRWTYYVALTLALALALWLALDMKSCRANQAVKPILAEAEQHHTDAKTEVKKAAIVRAEMQDRAPVLLRLAESVISRTNLPANDIPPLDLPEKARDLAVLAIKQEADRRIYELRAELAFRSYELSLDDKDKAIEGLQAENSRPKLTLGRAALLLLAGALLALLV